MCHSSPLSVMISLLMSTVDDGGERTIKTIRAISNPDEARETCQALNTESDRLAGKLDAISSLLESWSNHNPYPVNGSDEERGDRQNAYEAEQARLRDIILGATEASKLPHYAGDLPSYWIQSVKLD